MAFDAKTRRVALASASVLLCAAASILAAELKPGLSLEQASSRRAPTFAPAYEGEVVTVQGVVAYRPINYALYAHLAIQDEDGYGLVLEGTHTQFNALRPGQRIEARGTIAKRGGQPVLLPTHVQVISSGPAPAAKRVEYAKLQSFRNQGVFVVTDGKVVEKGEDTGGEFLKIGNARKPLQIYLPLMAQRSRRVNLDKFEVGDSVRVTGIAGQNCPLQPYDRYFEVVVASDDDIVLSNRPLVSHEWLAISLAFLVFALGVWWLRERRMAAQRNMVRTFYSLGEEMIGIASPLEVLNRLNAVLRKVMKITGANLYLYNRTTKTLERVAQSSEEAFSVPVFEAGGALPLGPAACYRNQALLTIPDTRRSPFFPDGRPERQPGSVMFVPMFAEAETLGVMELLDMRTEHEFSPDERVLTQHLANQIGIALRLMEEKSIREQLYRSEKLAAVGQLMSGIAAELRSPLDNISGLAENVLMAPAGSMWGHVEAISAEARKASEIVSRLVSFMQPDRSEAKRIELNQLLRSLIQFRRREWESRGVRIREMLSSGPRYILGSQGQLERVFLDMLVQAEHALAEAGDKTLLIATTILARRALVEFEYASGVTGWDGALAQPDPAAQSERVSRGIIHSHGGELRVTHSKTGECRVEIEFPLAPARLAAEAGGAQRAFTCLVVEPEADARQELVAALTHRGCRVVPAATAEDGIELVQRLRFEIVFCSVRLPGLNWIEFAESIRPQIGGFVLLTEGMDFELSRGMLDAESHILARPFTEPDIDHVLASVEERLSQPEAARFHVVRSSGRKAAGE